MSIDSRPVSGHFCWRHVVTLLAGRDGQRMVKWANFWKLIFSIVRSSTCSHSLTHLPKSFAIAAFTQFLMNLRLTRRKLLYATAENLRVFGTVCVSPGPPEVNSMHLHVSNNNKMMTHRDNWMEQSTHVPPPAPPPPPTGRIYIRKYMLRVMMEAVRRR